MDALEPIAAPIIFRPPTSDDVQAVAKLAYDAFGSFHDKHHFQRDFAAIEMAVGFAGAWIANPRVFGVLAERDGKIVGCNFLDERTSVAAVGPICVDPSTQGSGLGRKLMKQVIDRARAIGVSSVRLAQDAFNTASMSLYASLGFDVKEPLAVMVGRVAITPPCGLIARPMLTTDLPACAKLCRRVHGFDRNGELADALHAMGPFVLERRGIVVAYMSAPAFWLLNHGVAETQQDMKDLLAGASAQMDQPVGLLVPTRNADLFRWCLASGMRMVKPMSLMVMGEYKEPRGCWFPSVEY